MYIHVHVSGKSLFLLCANILPQSSKDADSQTQCGTQSSGCIVSKCIMLIGAQLNVTVCHLKH